ncbi:MAG: hypothetical protein P1P58_09150, partial [Treponema sp.]
PLNLSDYFTPTGTNEYTSDYATPKGSSGLFDLKLYLLVQDTVGNTKVRTLNILVDPAGDKPVISIIAPLSPQDSDTSKALSVGGKVAVYGSASVKVGNISEVLMDVSTDPNFGSYIDDDTDPSTDGKWQNKKIEGTMNWNTVLNKNGEIDALMTGSEQTVTVYYRVRAKNGTAPHKTSEDSQIQMLKFDKGAPVMEDAKLYSKQPDNSFTQSNYNLRAWVKQDDYLELSIRDASGIGKIQLKTSCGIDTTLEGKTEIDAYTSPSGTPGQKVFTPSTSGSSSHSNYTAKIPIRTQELVGEEYTITITVTEGTQTGSSFLTQTAVYSFRFDKEKPIGVFGKRISEGNSSFNGTTVPVNIAEAKAGRHLFINKE